MTPFVSSQGFGGFETAPRPGEANEHAAANDARRLAWQREMERAQADTWFFGFSPAPAHSADKPGFVPVSFHTSLVVSSTHDLGLDDAAPSFMPTSASGSPRSESDGASSAPRDLDPAGDTQRSPATNDIAAVASQAALSAAVSAVVSLRAVAVDPPPASPVSVAGGSAGSLAAASHVKPASDATATSELFLTPSPASQPAADAVNLTTATPDAAASAAHQASLVPGARLPSTNRVADAVRATLAPAEPIQLHVQWAGSSASIWIGLSGSATARLPELVDSLTRGLSKHGLRVRSIVCNGVTCYTQGSDREAASALPMLDIQLITSNAKD